jgi:hypothetical protein
MRATFASDVLLISLILTTLVTTGRRIRAYPSTARVTLYAPAHIDTVYIDLHRLWAHWGLARRRPAERYYLPNFERLQRLLIGQLELECLAGGAYFRRYNAAGGVNARDLAAGLAWIGGVPEICAMRCADHVLAGHVAARLRPIHRDLLGFEVGEDGLAHL